VQKRVECSETDLIAVPPNPDGNSDDALTYTPKGFLWAAAEARGLSARLYGEWSNEGRIAKKADGSDYTWSDFYNTALCKEGKAPKSSCIVPDDAPFVFLCRSAYEADLPAVL
jgi:hypothetical protein